MLRQRYYFVKSLTYTHISKFKPGTAGCKNFFTNCLTNDSVHVREDSFHHWIDNILTVCGNVQNDLNKSPLKTLIDKPDRKINFKMLRTSSNNRRERDTDVRSRLGSSRSTRSETRSSEENRQSSSSSQTATTLSSNTSNVTSSLNDALALLRNLQERHGHEKVVYNINVGTNNISFTN